MSGDDEEATAPADQAGVAGTEVAAEVAVLAARRYQPLDEVARGGAGRIVRARDLAFDREVALKEPLDPVHGADRLRAEAAILASLSHPSIVPVYDHGTRLDGVPFFAMKLVEGRSLRDVIRDAPALEQRLALIPQVVAVAEAVAYAHARGVIHRDLKPGNVLVGRFGETIVIDWGLAKHVDAAAPGAGAAEAARSSTITATGAVIGTPAYMAPEQARGDTVDARADVYALGAILYHVLAGAPPFAGRPGPDVIAAVLAGPPPPLGELQPRVPADLAAIAAQAMARAPGDRYPDAAGFAEDLVRFQTGRLVAARRYSLVARARRFARRRIGWIGAGVLAIASAAIAIAARPTTAPARPGAQCVRAGDGVRARWNPARQRSVRDAFVATGAPYAAGVAAAILPRLDGAADALAAARVDACEDTEARGERTQAQLALRMGCLDRQLAQLGAVVDALATADQALVDGAPRVVSDLDAPADCDDVDQLALAPPEPVDPGVHAQLERLRARLAATRTAIASRKERTVLDESEALEREATAIGYCPVAVLAQYLRAQALYRTAGSQDQTAAAATRLRQVALAADACGDDQLRARALITLVEATDPHDPAAVDRVLDEAEAASRRFDHPGVAARLLDLRAGIARGRGELDRAIELGQQAVEAARRDPDSDPAYAMNLALALVDKGELERAERLARDGAAGLRALYGADNPAVAKALMVVAIIENKRGQPERAAVDLAETLRVMELAHGPEHKDALMARGNLAATLLTAGKYAEAAAALERAVPIGERVLGPDHELTTSMIGNLATAYRKLDRLDEALALARTALASRVRTLGPDHLRTARAHHVVGEILEDRGDHAGAAAELTAALATEETALDARSPDLAATRLALAIAWLAGDAPAKALPLARAALRALATSDDATSVAEAELTVARALWRTGGDRAEARRLASAAQARADASAELRTRAAAWLAAPH